MSLAFDPADLRARLSGAETELVALHRALIRIPTVNNGDGASANETKLAEAAAKYLASAGIKAQILEGAPGRGNLVAEIGHGDHVSLWMSHSDVVPADPSEWRHHPFGAELSEGRIWGRGANDCKMLAACQLFALAQLAKMDLPKRRRIRLIVAADEEAGGYWGFGWLGRAHPDLLKANFAICEGGGGTLRGIAQSNGAGMGAAGQAGQQKNRPYVALGTGEKGRYEVMLRMRGAGGHASTPWRGSNPLAELARVIWRAVERRMKVAAVSPIFEALAPQLGLEDLRDGAAVDAAIVKLEADGAASLGSALRAQSRMTLTPTMVRGGERGNVIPTEAAVLCDARLLPFQHRIELEQALAEVCMGMDVEATVREINPASVTRWRAAMAGPFGRAVEFALGEQAEIVPYWCAGATDAHYVRAQGTPVFGFQFIAPSADPERLGIHCPDESIEPGMLMPCALTLAHLALDPAAPMELREGNGAEGEQVK